MKSVTRRATIYQSHIAYERMQALGKAAGSLSDPILDFVVNGDNLAADHATLIVDAIAQVKSLIEQMTEDDPRFAHAVELAQEKYESDEVWRMGGKG